MIFDHANFINSNHSNKKFKILISGCHHGNTPKKKTPPNKGTQVSPRETPLARADSDLKVILILYNRLFFIISNAEFRDCEQTARPVGLMW